MSEPEKRAPRGSEQIERRVHPRTGAVRFYARFTDVDGKRKHVKLGATTLEEARKNLRVILARVDAGQLGIERPSIAERAARAAERARKAVTVRQLAEAFCGTADNFNSGHGAGLRNPRWYRMQAWSVFKCHVLPHLGDRVASELRRVDVIRLLDALLGAGKTNRVVLRAIMDLSKLYNWARERELVASENPCTGVKKPKLIGSTSYYTNDEVARLLAKAAAKAPELHPIIAFAFYTGCRKGEIAALQVGDVDLAGGCVVVSRSWTASARKSGKAVVVQVHPHLDAILRPLLAGQEPTALVFPAAAGGMRSKFDLWTLDELVDMAGVRRFRNPWHSFRHSHATALAAEGADLAEIRDALGQSTLSMAANYRHLGAEHVRRRIAMLPALGPVAAVRGGSVRVTSLDTARRAS